MTPRQAKFVAEYSRTGNATQSAITAGYSSKAAAEIAYENLRKPQIVAALEAVKATALQLVAERLEEAVGTEAWIIEKAAEVVNRALNAVPVTRMEHGQRVTVDGEWTCDLGAATPALSLMARRIPAFKDAAALIDQSQHLHLPPGTTLEDVRALRDGLRQ